MPTCRAHAGLSRAARWDIVLEYLVPVVLPELAAWQQLGTQEPRRGLPALAPTPQVAWIGHFALLTLNPLTCRSPRTEEECRLVQEGQWGEGLGLFFLFFF